MLQQILGLFIKPVTSIITKRQDRKMAQEQIKGKLATAKQAGEQQVTLNEQEIEVVRTRGLENTWKDEYITVSVMSIFNIIVIGGLAAAFGEPRILEGVGIAITALINAGIDVGFILTATVLAGLGLSVWRKL